MAMEIRASEQDRVSFARPGRGRSSLGRSALWGFAAAAGLAVVITLAQTPSGTLRLQSAMAAIGAPDMPRPAAAGSAALAPAANIEIKALQAKLERLTAERDRIEARVAALEHGFQDVTGSVRQVQAAVAAPQLPSRPEPPAPARMTAPEANVPVIDPLAIPPAGSVPKLPKSAVVQQPAVAPIGPTEPARTAAAPAVAASPAPAELAPAISHPPQHVAAANPPPAAPVRHEYGIVLANAPDLDALRVRWTTAKANFGPLLAGLSPLAMRDTRHAGLHLVAGPLPSLAAARDLCTRFAALNGACTPTRVDPSTVLQR